MLNAIYRMLNNPYYTSISDIVDFALNAGQANEIDLEVINIRKFVKNIFAKGSKEDKRELINCLDTTLYFKDQTICTK
jgi:hypothetical protein